ncbi:uncharacterized protein LOC114754378 [Neltuma alba]|uniref:uncharacterized protein LOC114754378 n=1 Tax=Neltuma alba TaxID=207710 RepID=UPI0010A3CA2F|nr:uncharacterized protein LOC114754378 [Prosopis alba]
MEAAHQGTELDPSTCGVFLCHAAQSLLVQSLKNVRKIKLWECGNILSLSTLSIAASTISLESLSIRGCHKLKCITTHEGDAQVDNKNYCSIFPTLENLEIWKCEELEFLFQSSISDGLQKLKSLTITKVPELKYVVGNYQQDQQNEGLRFELPALETLSITHAPKIKSICAKNYKMDLPSLQNVELCNCIIKSLDDYDMMNLTTTEELDPSTCGVFLGHAAQSLLVQSLKNVTTIELTNCGNTNCGNIISMSTLSIAASTISLGSLSIRGYHKLKCITTHEGDAQVDNKNYCSIFPTLENLVIWDCEELEFVFQSSISGGLQKLKSLTITEVPELKYVVGNYQQDQQNEGLRFELPALETLSITHAPKIKSICARNYKMDLASLQKVELWDCGIKSLDDYDMMNLTTTEELGASTEGVPPFLVAQSLLVQSLKNVTTIELTNCGNIISLSTLSIAASTISLESLSISKCHKLKCITTHEGDAQVDNKNYCSIFPTLENLYIRDCKALEFVFQSSISGGLQKLKSLYIREVPELKYVVGNYQQDQQNEGLRFELPALENFIIENAPKMNSVCAKNYKMDLSSLQNVELWSGDIKSFDDSDMVNLTTTEELNSSTGLSIIRCDQLKCIVEDEADIGTRMNYNYSIFPKLKWLEVSNCNALEYLFPSHAFRCPACLVRSLPMSQKLSISKCEELVNNVEEDYEKNDDDHHQCREPCFPNLEKVSVIDCDKLSYLFSIPISGILPKLRSLKISRANGLEHALVRQGEMKEMAMKDDVLPKLSKLELIDLPNLLWYEIEFSNFERRR